ncbi:MAG: dockerin, partial [Clostridia bacterium]
MKRKLALFVAVIFVISLVPAFTVGAASPTLTVNMTEKTGAMRHGSAGFLYGLGSHGTPNPNMLTPLKPGTAVQKAPDGLQHPTGDVLDVAETFIEAGGEQVQIYLQDIYALWDYEYTGIDDYLKEIEKMVPKIVALRESNPDFNGKLVYVPYNEPDGIWFQNVDGSAEVQARFNEYWQKAYELIHQLDPEALVGGASYASYRGNAMESWIKFCVENNCEPDYITWHELQTDKLSSFKSHLDHYRSLEQKYGMNEREIIINEYAPQDHCSVPGKLVNWIALFEENKVSGCLPYWHNAGNLDDIAADNNQPNGAWWLYKWYGDMSGETLRVETSTSRDQLYGLASIDDNKRSA